MSSRTDIRSIALNTPLFVRQALPRSVAQSLLEHCLCREQETAETLADILLQRETLHLEPVNRYVAYLKIMAEITLALAEFFDLRSPPGSEGRKEHLRHTGPEDLIHLINHLYVLVDEGVEGCVLECGTSHGYSTCCLSHACDRLQRQLFAADSFQGLPAQASAETFFRPGDYASPKDVVAENIRAYGCAESVSLVEGWFSESLRGWKVPVALLWLDVDLYDSARDVMSHVLPYVQRKGIVVLHEFTDFHNRLPARNARRPPNAVFDAMEEAGVREKGIHIHRYLGAVAFDESVVTDSFAVAEALWPGLIRMDSRWRRYDELRNARTVRWLFTLKRWLLRR